MEQFQLDGAVTGFKEMHGDNVHRHLRFHNRPDHCLIFTSISQYIADGTVETRSRTAGTSQTTSLCGNNRWRTFDVLQWPLGCTVHQYITGKRRT
eukprot:6491300-Amphidinium_carterae.3